MKPLLYKISLFVMATFYFSAGVNHFVNPDFYLRMMPPYIPAHREMILLSGAFEIVFAVMLLFKRTHALAAWGIIAMLIVFFSVHIYMIQVSDTVFADIPEWFLWARLPLQFLFIYWAYIFTRWRKA